MGFGEDKVHAPSCCKVVAGNEGVGAARSVPDSVVPVLGALVLDEIHGYQRRADVPHFCEQAMQRCLIDDRSAQAGCSIVLSCEDQAFEPIGPGAVEVPADADFVLPWPVMICWHVAHPLSRT